MADIRTLKEGQITQLRKAADVMEPSSRLAGVVKEAAILGANVAEESNGYIESAARLVADALANNAAATREGPHRLGEELERVFGSLDEQVSALTKKIDEFTTQADEGTRKLKNWTIVLAVATILLFLATVGLVVASLVTEAPQAQIVVVPTPPK